MTIHSPAQRAAYAAARAKFGKGGRFRKQLEAAPVTLSQSNGIFGPMIKVLDANTRSLIDDAMRKRMIAQADPD